MVTVKKENGENISQEGDRAGWSFRSSFVVRAQAKKKKKKNWVYLKNNLLTYKEKIRL